MKFSKTTVVFSLLLLAVVSPAPIQTHDPAARPKERNLSDAERMQQQSSAPVIGEMGDPELKSNYEDSRYSSDPNGENAIKNADKNSADLKKIDGEGALKQAENDVENMKKRPLWKAPIFLFGFAVLGFAAVAFLRKWADRVAPYPKEKPRR